MHTEVFDGNKNTIEIEKPQIKSMEVYDKTLKEEPTAVDSNAAPSRDTSSETIDVTTVPVTTENGLDAGLNNETKAPTVPPPSIAEPVVSQTHSYTREVLPPNSIYGIESLTSKPYEPSDMKLLPEGIHSPRYPSHNIASPLHSSPDKDPTRHVHRAENNAPWMSPVKAHNYRGPCPPTSPYIDSRGDPSYANGPRRYLPPFYGGGRNFIHPNDRTRYSAYPLGSPLLSTLGYPREPLDTRYQLHMNPGVGFEEDKFKLSPPSMDDKHIWTKQEVELLLDLYEEHKSKLQDPRVRKTKVWDDIAKQIHEKLDADVNGCQCNQKFRNMKADYQKVIEHNARSGSFRKTCKYYDRLEKLLTPVSEPDKLKEEMEGDGKYFNGIAFGSNQNGFPSKAGTPNGFYEREMSRTSSSPESGENNRPYENGTGSSGTPSSPEKRPLNHIESASDDSSPPPSKRPFTQCSCGGVNKRELIEVLKEFLKEQRKREEETINKIQTLHKEKIDTVVKFLDLFQELVKKV
ncbi:uncharacterized protein LOC130621572 [Hydractinia symbiolongicarpus]|uniref:uncharacterized protein LOC130621572 n=1 Tax=Hydractinia symbiolongicarpus TaxID=13093 RepID=UPI00254A917C|nr:uncharacterized protein LOC130621572 [Hydractinia symbiolongicarpus]